MEPPGLQETHNPLYGRLAPAAPRAPGIRRFRRTSTNVEQEGSAGNLPNRLTPRSLPTSRLPGCRTAPVLLAVPAAVRQPDGRGT